MGPVGYRNKSSAKARRSQLFIGEVVTRAGEKATILEIGSITKRVLLNKKTRAVDAHWYDFDIFVLLKEGEGTKLWWSGSQIAKKRKRKPKKNGHGPQTVQS